MLISSLHCRDALLMISSRTSCVTLRTSEAVARYAGPLDDGALTLREERGRSAMDAGSEVNVCVRISAQLVNIVKSFRSEIAIYRPSFFRFGGRIGALGVGYVRVRGSEHHDIRRQDVPALFSHDKTRGAFIERSFFLSSRCLSRSLLSW